MDAGQVLLPCLKGNRPKAEPLHCLCLILGGVGDHQPGQLCRGDLCGELHQVKGPLLGALDRPADGSVAHGAQGEEPLPTWLLPDQQTLMGQAGEPSEVGRT
eukprot:10874071-Lingulodinium_polyedra.AAC.1